MKLNTTFLIISFISINTFAKSRIVDLQKEFQNRKFCGVYEILDYDTIPFLIENTIDTLKTKKFYVDIIERVKVRELVSDSIFYVNTAIKSELYLPLCDYIDIDSSVEFTGYWPDIHDSVFMLADSLNQISVFGLLDKNHYRIWSPYETGSLAIFRINPPFKELPDAENCYEIRNIKSCRDGCLVPVQYIVDRCGSIQDH